MSLQRRQSKFNTIFGPSTGPQKASSPGRRPSTSSSDTPPSTRGHQPGSKPVSLRQRASFQSDTSEYRAQLAQAMRESMNHEALQRHRIDLAPTRRSHSQTRNTTSITTAPAEPWKVKIPPEKRSASQDSYGNRKVAVSPYPPGYNPYGERTTRKPGPMTRVLNIVTSKFPGK